MKFSLDALGIGASVACAIHCAMLPLFFTSLPLFGVNVIDNVYFEGIMMLIALLIGCYAFYHGYRKHHHSVTPFLIFLAGFSFLVLKEFFLHSKTWLLIPAVILIIFAHIYNYRSCRVHNHAHADDCVH